MFDLTELEGSYAPAAINPADFDEVTIYLNAELSAGAAHGEIMAYAVSGDGSDDPDSAVSARRVDIATY